MKNKGDLAARLGEKSTTTRRKRDVGGEETVYVTREQSIVVQ